MQKRINMTIAKLMVVMCVSFTTIATVVTYSNTANAQVNNDWQKLINNQHFDRILNTADAILQIDSNNQDALFYRALALYQSGQEELAIPYFNHLIDQNLRRANHISAYRLALCHFYLGNNQKAIVLFKKVLSQQAPPYEAQLMLAYSLARDNQLKAAVAIFDQLLAQQKNHSLYYNRALAHWELNQLAAAKADLRSAINAKPEFHLPYFDLISICVLQEQTDEALQWLDKLLANREINLARLQQDPVLVDFITSDAYLALLKKHKIN